MMSVLIVEKNQLPHLIDNLIEKYSVYAPLNRDGGLCFGEVKSSKDVNPDFRSTISPKEVLFPKCETLFTYKVSNSNVTLKEPRSLDEKRVIFGLHPCEARGFMFIDKAFTSGEFKDPYYLQRRKNTFIIGKSCETPKSTCFCTSVGGSPFGKEGVDLLLQDLGDRYLLEVVSDKGEELAKELPRYKKASESDIQKARHVAKIATDSVFTELALQNIEEKLEKMFTHPLWDTVYEKCVGCGICTYLCPTCYCFDIIDETKGSDGKRIRIWDSCQFPLFTLQGSGENPRPSGKERMRQRIMHKFNYHPKNYGGIACVGCGRCVRECPVNLDIREILSQILVI